MSSAYYSTSQQIDQHMRGQAWHIESYGIEQNARDRRWRHVTTAWSVYIYPHLVHTYEVAQWSYSTLFRTHTVRLLEDGRLTCTCTAGQSGFARSRRGYCLHVNRLMVHAVRRHATLPAPAAQLAPLVAAQRAGTGAALSASAAPGRTASPARGLAVLRGAGPAGTRVLRR